MRYRALLFTVCLLPGACSDDAGTPDARPADARLTDAGPRERGATDLPRGDARRDGPRADSKAPPPDSKAPCTAPTPPRANFVDTCKLAHRPQDKAHLSARTPAATAPVTVRLQTQAGDVRQVLLRVWTGHVRQLTMSKESTKGGLDTYRAQVPASARPAYYRFVLTDGAATLYLTAKGPRSAKPTGADDFFIAPQAKGKTVHYVKTTFTKPQLRYRLGGASYSTAPMVFEVGQRAGVTVPGSAGKELWFHIRDAATNIEDHPPGGGDYRMAAGLGEAWLDLGTLFDEPPDRLKLGPLDCHTHPYNKSGSSLVFDTKPLTTLLPQQGITRAISMVPGSLSGQQSAMTALHRAQRWIVPIVWVNPKSHTAAAVEPLLTQHGFAGLKFHPSVHSFAADAAMMDPLMKLAAKHRVPVQIHSAKDDNSKPWRIVALAKRHPTVPVIMIHTELGTLNKAAALNQIKGTKNVYAETSWTNPESVLQAMQALDSSRTLFGTDSTVDGMQQFTKKSIANPAGQYVYTVSAAAAQVKAKAHPGAWANWAYLTAVRLYSWRFRPDPDLYDTDGDGAPDEKDGDDDNDGKVDGKDAAPRDPSR